MFAKNLNIGTKNIYLCGHNQSKLREEGRVHFNQCLRILLNKLGFNSIVELLKKCTHRLGFWLPNTWLIHYQQQQKHTKNRKHRKKIKINKSNERRNIHIKLFPRSPTSTLDPSITVMLPIPPRTRFFKVSEPVGPQLSKHTLAFSRAACPCSPQILQFRH